MCLRKILSLFGFDSINLTKAERYELKKIERESYVSKAKELAKERGERKANNEYSY